MNKRHLVVILLGLLVSQLSYAKNGTPGGKTARTENATGIVTMLTQDISSVDAGLFSDEWTFGDANSNLRYYSTVLNGLEDPDNPGESLDDGDCVSIVTPSADGVDQGKLVLFVPFQPADCPDPGRLRQLKVLGSGRDLDGVGGATDPELIDARFGCDDVFPQDSPVSTMGTTTTSCGLEVREYDASNDFERTWIIEWPVVTVTHLEIDLRQLDTSADAEIFQLVAPANGKGKKDKVSLGYTPLPFRLQIRRVVAP